MREMKVIITKTLGKIHPSASAPLLVYSKY